MLPFPCQHEWLNLSHANTSVGPPADLWVGGRMGTDGQDWYLSHANKRGWPYPIPTRVSGPLLIFGWVGGIGRMVTIIYFSFHIAEQSAPQEGGNFPQMHTHTAKKFVMFCKHCKIKLLKILFLVHRMAALKKVKVGFPSFSETKICILLLTVYI